MENKKRDGKKVGVWLSEDEYQKLATAASEAHRTISEIVREMIFKQLAINGAIDGIDFFREQVREEVEAAIIPRMERIISLLTKVGMFDITMCQFTSKLIHALVPRKDKQGYEPLETRTYEQMMRESRANAYRIIKNNDKDNNE